MIKRLYEHLITKGKYNTLDINYKLKCEEYDEKVVELRVSEDTNKIMKKKFNEKIDDLVAENIKLKEEIKMLKKK